MRKKRQAFVSDETPADLYTPAPSPATLRVSIRGKICYQRSMRRMTDGTMYVLNKGSFTEIDARHFAELAAQEPYLFQFQED